MAIQQLRSSGSLGANPPACARRWTSLRPAMACGVPRSMCAAMQERRVIATRAVAAQRDWDPTPEPYDPHRESLFQFSNSMLDGRCMIPDTPSTPRSMCYNQLRASELAAVINALAELPQPPPCEELIDLVAASYNQLMHFTAQELATTIAALASWHHVPDDEWMERYEQQTYRCVTDANSDEIATYVWGFAQLGYSPQLVLDALLDAAQDGLEANSWKASSMASITWALGQLGAQPSKAWAHALLRASYVKLLSFAPSELAKLLWGLAKMNLRPNAKWVGAFLAAAQVSMPLFDTKSLSLTIWALATLSYRPAKEWMAVFERQVGSQVREFGAQEMTCLLWSLVAMTSGRQEPLGVTRAGQQGFAALDYQVLQSSALLGVILNLRQGSWNSSSGNSGSSSAGSSGSS